MKGMHGMISGNQLPQLNYLERNPKFHEEKVCMETERYLVHFDGLLLDHSKPVRDGERFELLTGLYEQHGTGMTACLKGQYNLVIWDKQKKKVLVSNDLLSKRSMYYCLHKGCLLYAASYEDLLEMLSALEDYRPQINEQALERMALNGALDGEQTYVQGVRYLDAWQALCFDLETGAAEVIDIPQKAENAAVGMEKAVEDFDRLFTAAVRAQFEKNSEYGYQHVIALSGGMDSRACLLKAVQCGYGSGMTCVNYAQSGSIDYEVSQQIAFDNDLDYLFYPMDAAVFTGRLSEMMDCNECQQSSIGSTGARTIARLLDKSQMGMMHTGLCGGELMGDLTSSTAGGGRLYRLLRRLGIAGKQKEECTFRRREYLDNIRACQNFSHMFLADCETVSPFLDEDVVRFVLQLDPALLYRRQLYREWMKKHIPNEYTTTYFCGPVSISPGKEICAKVWNAVIKRAAGTSRRDMNPVEHWLNTRPAIAERCAGEYRNGMAALKEAGISDQLLKVFEQRWQCGGEAQFYVLTAMEAAARIGRIFRK